MILLDVAKTGFDPPGNTHAIIGVDLCFTRSFWNLHFHVVYLDKVGKIQEKNLQFIYSVPFMGTFINYPTNCLKGRTNYSGVM